MELRYCIQCRDRVTGQVGDFAYHVDKPFEAVSPVFPDLIQFFMWTKQNRYIVFNDFTLTRL